MSEIDNLKDSVNPGDRPSAAERNAIVAALKSLFSSSGGDFFIDSSGVHVRSKNVAPQPGSVVLVKNTSGSDLDRFAILGISDVVTTQATDDELYKRYPMVVGSTPAKPDALGAFVVLKDPIPNGGIGYAWCSGLCIAQVDIISTDDPFCDVTNSAANLESSMTGSAKIVVAESASTGVCWCVIQLGSWFPPPIPDRDKDYMLIYDAADKTIKWAETATECPTA
jgi:hypothetical protein